MKRMMVSSAIALAIGLTFVFTAAVLLSVEQGINWAGKSEFISLLYTIGYIMAALAGVLFTGCAIMGAIRGGDAKKLMTGAVVVTAVGLSMIVLYFVVLTGLAVPNTAAFSVDALMQPFNTIGYLLAILGGVTLVACGVANVAKGEK